ncbi:MAG: DNA-binding MarR family transcriptional regulator [Gammaproteobacteria bacterium]
MPFNRSGQKLENSKDIKGCLDVPDQGDATKTFEISAFFPYQTRVFYKSVSEAVAKVYIDEYDMKPYEWRALAILGKSNMLTPAQLVEESSMDKVTVSRAIASLSKRGWLRSRSNKMDGRSRIVSTSAEGQKAFANLVPKMRAVEHGILRCLDDHEAAEFKRIMQKIVDHQG